MILWPILWAMCWAACWADPQFRYRARGMNNQKPRRFNIENALAFSVLLFAIGSSLFTQRQEGRTIRLTDAAIQQVIMTANGQPMVDGLPC